MECRESCGACCIAPSINTPMPGMPEGKPAGIRCNHLNENFQCDLWQKKTRPVFCGQFKAEESICGGSRHEAIQILDDLESLT